MTEPIDTKANTLSNDKIPSVFRFGWMLVPFLVLGLFSFVMGIFQVFVLDRYFFVHYFLVSLSLAGVLGILGGRFAVRCLWKASFHGNNNRIFRTIYALILAIWSIFWIFAGFFIQYYRLLWGFYPISSSPVQLYYFFIYLNQNHSILAQLLVTKFALLTYLMIQTLRKPFR